MKNFFSVVGNLLFKKSSTISVTDTEPTILPAEARPMIKADDATKPTLEEALYRLSRYEGIIFTRRSGNEVNFIHHSEQFSKKFKIDELKPFLPRFQQCMDLFVEMKEQGITVVDVPADITFHPISAAFTDSSLVKPKDRPVTMEFSCGNGPEYAFTKSKLDIDVVIDHWREAMEQFTAAVTAPEFKPVQNSPELNA